MDRLPWARSHSLVVVQAGHGVAVLDGLEVAVVGSMSEALKPASTGLGISSERIGVAVSGCVAGACIEAFFFGEHANQLRTPEKVFLMTLGVYTASPGPCSTAYS